MVENLFTKYTAYINKPGRETASLRSDSMGGDKARNISYHPPSFPSQHPVTGETSHSEYLDMVKNL